MVVFETPNDLSLGMLADLLVAWAEGEISEGRMAAVTGIDRLVLRGLKLGAIDRALAFVTRHSATRAATTPAPPPSSRNPATSTGGSGATG
jgi:hypothetical protein